MSTLSLTAAPGMYLNSAQARELIAQACPAKDYKDKKVLLIVPDATRTCPLGILFAGLFDQIGTATRAFDVMIALGTHQPMSEEAICERLEISLEERRAKYGSVRFFNHEWDNDAALRKIGDLTLDDTRALTDGLLEMEVPVKINARVFDYDQVIICGPVSRTGHGLQQQQQVSLPRRERAEVAFLPLARRGGDESDDHRQQWTPVHKVVDRVGAMVTVPSWPARMVVDHAQLAGLFIRSPEGAWDQASELSKKLHIEAKESPVSHRAELRAEDV